VNFARRGRGGFGCGGPSNRGCTGRGGRSPVQGHGGQGMNSCQGGCGNSGDRPQCQVCLKFCHAADRCWYRFKEDYVPEPSHNVAAVTSSYSVDTN
jgi:hypothetical protein